MGDFQGPRGPGWALSSPFWTLSGPGSGHLGPGSGPSGTDPGWAILAKSWIPGRTDLEGRVGPPESAVFLETAGK